MHKPARSYTTWFAALFILTLLVAAFSLPSAPARVNGGIAQDRRVGARDRAQDGALTGPAERGFELRPPCRLKDVTVRVARDELIPRGVGVDTRARTAAFRVGDPNVLRLG
jgi:hypothetical protein